MCPVDKEGEDLRMSLMRLLLLLYYKLHYVADKSSYTTPVGSADGWVSRYIICLSLSLRCLSLTLTQTSPYVASHCCSTQD